MLPSETRMYVPLFIAANYAMTYYGEHNIEPVLPVKPLTVDSVTVSHRLYFEHISKVMDIPMEALKELNPQYRCDIIPASSAKSYSLTLPSQQAFAFVVMQESIIAFAKKEMEAQGITEDDFTSEPTPIYHKVRSGETLSKIARKYNTTVKNIKKWSGIKSDRLRVGVTARMSTPNLLLQKAKPPKRNRRHRIIKCARAKRSQPLHNVMVQQ